MGNLGCIPGESQLGQSRYPAYDTCWVCLCFYNPPNSDMDYRIFNVRTDVNACDCARGCTDTVRESALNVDSGRKIPCRTGESNLRQRRAGPKAYQLSYIPTCWTQLACEEENTVLFGGYLCRMTHNCIVEQHKEISCVLCNCHGYTCRQTDR